MGIRRKSRELAVQALYMYELSDTDIHNLLSFEWSDKSYNEKILIYASDLIRGTLNNIEYLDNIIGKVMKDEISIKRMGEIEKAILRVMSYEMLKKDVPKMITIDEGVEIAKKFGNEYSHKFINGILDEIRKKYKKPVIKKKKNK